MGEKGKAHTVRLAPPNAPWGQNEKKTNQAIIAFPSLCHFKTPIWWVQCCLTRASSYFFEYTIKPAHNSQIRSQTKSTLRSRWRLRATATYEITFMDRIKKKSTRSKHSRLELSTYIMQLICSAWWVLPNGIWYCLHWLLCCINGSDMRIESFLYWSIWN